jgi:hypothetical protein
MIEKRALVPWVEAQDKPRGGADKNENGAPDVELSSSHTQKKPDKTTTLSRIFTVICPYPGKKVDTFSHQ